MANNNYNNFEFNDTDKKIIVDEFIDFQPDNKDNTDTGTDSQTDSNKNDNTEKRPSVFSIEKQIYNKLADKCYNIADRAENPITKEFFNFLGVCSDCRGKTIAGKLDVLSDRYIHNHETLSSISEAFKDITPGPIKELFKGIIKTVDTLDKISRITPTNTLIKSIEKYVSSDKVLNDKPILGQFVDTEVNHNDIDNGIEKTPNDVEPKETPDIDKTPNDVEPKEVPDIENTPNDVEPKEVPDIEKTPNDVEPKEVPDIEKTPNDVEPKEAPDIEKTPNDVEPKEVPDIEKTPDKAVPNETPDVEKTPDISEPQNAPDIENPESVDEPSSIEDAVDFEPLTEEDKNEAEKELDPNDDSIDEKLKDNTQHHETPDKEFDDDDFDNLIEKNKNNNGNSEDPAAQPDHGLEKGNDDNADISKGDESTPERIKEDDPSLADEIAKKESDITDDIANINQNEGAIDTANDAIEEENLGQELSVEHIEHEINENDNINDNIVSNEVSSSDGIDDQTAADTDNNGTVDSIESDEGNSVDEINENLRNTNDSLNNTNNDNNTNDDANNVNDIEQTEQAFDNSLDNNSHELDDIDKFSDSISSQDTLNPLDEISTTSSINTSLADTNDFLDTISNSNIESFDNGNNELSDSFDKLNEVGVSQSEVSSEFDKSDVAQGIENAKITSETPIQNELIGLESEKETPNIDVENEDIQTFDDVLNVYYTDDNVFLDQLNPSDLSFDDIINSIVEDPSWTFADSLFNNDLDKIDNSDPSLEYNPDYDSDPDSIPDSIPDTIPDSIPDSGDDLQGLFDNGNLYGSIDAEELEEAIELLL